MTATLQRVIIIRNRYHTKWYCVRDPIYCHLEMDRRGEMSDRDSDPAPFVRNSYIPETQRYLNYCGSQCYYEEPQALPQYYYFPQSQPQGPQVKGAGASMRNINSRNKVPVASESTAESNEGAKTSGKRKSTKYETFPHAEERYLVNLWKENHDQLESKNARKVWSKIVDDLNTRFKSNRTVDKCMRKIKYLIDKYKEKKDWNRNQSGGNLRKSPFYDEIDEVLGCRDFVTFSNVKESAVVYPNASTSSASTSASTTPKGSVVDSDVANHEKSPDDVRKERRQRKKRRNTAAEHEDSAIASTLEGVKEQGDKLTNVLEEMQKSQVEQMKMMSQFMGAMVEAMKNAKN